MLFKVLYTIKSPWSHLIRVGHYHDDMYMFIFFIDRPGPKAHSYRLGHGMYSVVYGTVHYKETLKSFEIRVGHSHGFGFLSVAIFPWLCRKRREQYSYIYLRYRMVVVNQWWSILNTRMFYLVVYINFDIILFWTVLFDGNRLYFPVVICPLVWTVTVWINA